MKLIKPSVEIWEQEPGVEGMYRQVERVARISYKSEARMTEDSSKPFVNKLIARGHLSCLEHGTVYLDITDHKAIMKGFKKYSYNPYSKVYKNALEESWERPHLYVTTNLRVLWENQWMDDLEWFCNPTEYHSKRHCVHFISDIGTMREFFRHRTINKLVA